ncbi:mitochondrial antiviral-signaling protein [Falco naumanni]|uniref:mitochondrial antiviral-signaling protein n=1 Tax=Falco naumanni TaxID=148594 RepID=UPI001ADE889E|nr:mitochondrial antiviral-signaling protein [Falco naumanni]XP_040447062.1 mitochondrial antiviral-signaling protein [Falco naumanni]XP_040447073.1 mitochondrial antiviral-signaling protein [Falco naumanni]XP_040447084.1 mitochondrial antiviral-signaling protein [Falco naumanni]
MGFAEDKVYDYILQNFKNFKNIRVASLADSLSCLTDDDRDELHTREEMRGSQATVYRFYQHLKCRQGWVLDLIEALRQNNAGHLADELQHVYNSWQISPPAAASASFPPAVSNARPAVSSVGSSTPSTGPSPALGTPLAEQPCQDPPVGSHPPLLPSAATVTGMDLDARVPVQESLPKTFLEQESPQSPPPESAVCDGVSDGHSGERHHSHPIKTTQVAPGTPRADSVAVTLAAPPPQGRDWLGRQQHPVCVDNGCFGNANHLHRGAPGLGLGRSLPLRDTNIAHSPRQPRNEPQEDFYVSTESVPRLEEATRSRGSQPPNTLPEKQVVPSFEHGEPPDSFVDVRSPLLIQQQFDTEQKCVGMWQEHRGGEETLMETTTLVATLAPRDASLFCDTSTKPPVQEKELPTGETASSTPSMLMKEEVVSASVDTLLGTTVVGKAERTASRVSSATSVWESGSNIEGDVELSKPGILLSTDGERPEAAGICPGSQGPCGPYSTESNSFTLGSEQLMVSTDSSSSGEQLSRVSLGCPAPAAPAGGGTAGASRDSHPPSSWYSTSLGTHEVHVDHYPSTQLEAGGDLQDRAGPPGNSPDSSRGRGTVTSSSQAKVPPGDSNGPSLPYIFAAVGIAVISAVAFLVYARLQK